MNIVDTEEIASLAEEAYIFAYPILENYRTMDRLTGVNTPEGQRRMFNSLRHTTKLLGPDFKNIVAPNNDTLYSSTWLDLDKEPQVLSVPEITDGRYYVFQLVSMYNHNFGYIGSRATGYAPADYLIAGPNWDSEVPSGVKQLFHSETRFAFLVGRTLVDGPQDIDLVKTVQSGYRLRPLSQYLGKRSNGPSTPDPILPYDKEKASTAEFINYLNVILEYASIHPSEVEMLDRFAAIGIEPGKPFSRKSLPDNIIKAIEQGMQRARAKIEQKVTESRQVANGWRSLVDSHGSRKVMAGRYLANAAGAMVGLYGNDKEEASNFAAFVDENGDELDASKHDYILTFDADGFPPVNAFWSITMYRKPEILLVANPIGRYSIGNHSKQLSYDRDGSLKIYIQHSSPGPGKESNWLPAPPGPFIMALRNYWPKNDFVDTYMPPAIRKIVC